MPDTCPTDDRLLMKSEKWNPPEKGKSKLEEVRNTIFHLRHNRGRSFTAIKRFLAEAGIKTSTAALSKYFKSRFSNEREEEMKANVLARLADLKLADANGNKKSTT